MSVKNDSEQFHAGGKHIGLCDGEPKELELKYEYKEDQWSLLNPEGKKQYDRNFLLNLQYVNDSVTKPEGLPVLQDVILINPLVPGCSSHMEPHMRQCNVPDFRPGFIKPVNSKECLRFNYRSPWNTEPDRRQGDRSGRGKQSSQQEDVKLHTAEQAWKPSHKDQGNELDKNDELLKKVRSILNKLTPQKFKKLMQQMIDLRMDMDTQDRLIATTNLIVETAVDAPNYAVVYANMCKCMSGAKVPREDKPDEFVTFRKILLNRCQKEFEKDKTTQLDLEKMQQEIDDAPKDRKKVLEKEQMLAEIKAKRRKLGILNFLGELFKLKMLTEAIMHSCMMNLIRSNDEDNLECLCRLLTTTGKELDHEKAKQRMDQYFAHMQKIVDQKRTCSRVRFLLMDIIELRLNNWLRSRQQRSDNSPRLIEEIHREAQRARYQGYQPPKGMDGWQSVGKACPLSIDPSKMKLTHDGIVDENIGQHRPHKTGGGFWGNSISAKVFSFSPQKCDHSPRFGRLQDLRIPTPSSRQISRSLRIQLEKPAAKELSPSELEQQSNSLLEEYLHVNDLNEAIHNVRDLESPNSLHLFVYHAMNKVLKSSDKARKQVPHLLHDLVRQGHLTTEHYLRGLNEILKFAVNIPCVWKDLGELIGNMVYDNTVPLESLKGSLNHSVLGYKAGEVIAFVLHNMAHNMGHIKVGKQWKASGLKWSDFLSPSENVQAFVKPKQVEFTVCMVPRSPDPSMAMPMQKVSIHLERLIVERGMDNEDIFYWIAANVSDSQVNEPAFIKALMTSVCNSAIKISESGEDRTCKMEKALFQKRFVLLQKYLDHKAELELEALCALQALVYKLEDPPGLLRQFFDSLYEEEMISEDVFNQWAHNAYQ